MTKKEQIIAILEKMGYSPNIDSDGDVAVRYELKYIYFITDDDDPHDHYASVLFPQFYEIKEGEETLVLTTCNKMAREVRLVKVYLDGSFKNVTASCEFFFTDEEALERNITESLNLIGVVRTMFRQFKADLSED